MKYLSVHIIIRLVVYTVCLSGTVFPALADGIRITPGAITVENDSLHLQLEMDLNAVRVNSLTAIYFTPLLQGGHKQISLPPVVVTGSKRFHFERRERALAVGKPQQAIPFRVLPDNRKTGSKIVRYQVSVPYASWMGTSSLLLRQDIKDCCDLQLLGVDTLTRDIAVTPAAPIRSRIQPALTDSVKTLPDTIRIPAVAIMAVAPENYGLTLSVQPPAVTNKVKQHVLSTVLYIDYPLGKDDVYPDYRNNRKEIEKVDAILSPLLAERQLLIRRIRVRGYASPDGSYRNNEQLAANRSRLFSGYIRDAYALPDRLFDVSSVAEDWKGLAELLDRTKPPYYREALDIISTYGIFSGREKHLMDFRGGIPYKDMLKNLFPKLRRIEVVVEYDSLVE